MTEVAGEEGFVHPYLLGLRLAGRRVLVVGGGGVAARRVPAMLDTGAVIVLVSPEVTASLEDLAAGGRITWVRRPYQAGDCQGAWLVCACTDDAAVNRAVADEAEAERIWCVRADSREESAAWTPAQGGTGDVRIGVLTGSDPRRAAAIRDALLREAAVRDPGLREAGRREAGQRDLGPEGREESAPGPKGTVAIVGGGPGDPGLITVRGRELLGMADVVVTDRLAPRSLLDELPETTEIVDAAKIPYGRAMAQEQINELLISRARQGKFVVRLKGGDPFVFGRGAEEVLACAEAGISTVVVPGVTSAIGVPTAAGVPVTHRGVAQDVHVISAHVPPGDEQSTVDWPALAASRGTLVLLMALERIGAIADALIRYGRNPGTPVSLIADGTLPTQRTMNSTLENVAGLVLREAIRPPAVVVVGEVVNIAVQIAEISGLTVTPGRQTG
jgi:uroporphyrin-III C-methyltransferase / precorrin-2 dehydrogenase / sirohydrochlorin ferrochelatase